MPGIQWTDPDVDLPYLMSKLPDYHALQTASEPQKRNNQKKIFLNHVTGDYIQRFSARYAVMDIPGAPVGSSDDIQEMKLHEVGIAFIRQNCYSPFIQRLKNWFQNHHNSPTTTAETGKKNDVLDLSGKTSECVEQTVNAYHRLNKELLQKDIDVDFETNGGSDSRIAHRNKYLAKRFKDEPENVKAHVRESRMKPNERRKHDIKWLDEDELSEEEKLRRETALEYSS
jgi:hypothetical protein